MKPILYPESETNFTTNGLGRLNPLMCHVTKERNGQYDLEMDIRIDDRHYADLKEYRIIYAPHDNTNLCQPFEIYKITRPIDGVVTVFANHVYYRTAKTTVMPCTAQSCSAAMSAISSNIAGTSQFTLSTDISGSGTFTVEKPEKMRDLLGGIRGSLLDVYGGEYVFDHFNIILKSAAGSEKNVTLRYGKNITDLKKTTDSSNIWTGIAPFWLGTDGNSTSLVTLPEKAVYSTEEPNYQYKMVIPMDFSDGFTGKPTEAQLRAKAEAYVQNNAPTGIPSSIDVSFVQLWETEEYRNIANLERVNLCDTITIEHEALGVSNKAKIVRTVYDVLNERYVEMTIGDVRTSLGDTIAAAAEAIKEVAVSKSALQMALEAAAKLINGGLGGHVVINTDSDGHPNEILIMDTDNINTAVNVLRLNMLGIGFSVNGYNGPFTSAWTIDGHFCADFITAGHLNANYIQGGTLVMGGSNNGNGTIEVKNAQGQTIILLDNGGIDVTAGTIHGPNIIVGGAGNANGIFQVLDGSSPANEICRIDINGIKNSQPVKIWNQDLTVRDALAEVTTKKAMMTFFVESKLRGFIGCETTLDIGQSAFFDEQKFYVLGGKAIIIGLACNSSGSTSFTQSNYECLVIDRDSNGNIRIKAQKPFYANGGVVLGNFKYITRDGDNSEANIHFEESSPHTNLHLKGYNVYLAAGYKAFYNNQEIAVNGSSSRRYKHSIKPLGDEALDPHRLLKLKPAQFVFNKGHPLQYRDMAEKTLPGFIAEDVAEIYPSAAIVDPETGRVENWDERRIIPGMIALIQEQQKEIETLKQQVRELCRPAKEGRQS